ncbi:MAG: hypothetical protein WAV20_03035 [Blastocatellia bacterium]
MNCNDLEAIVTDLARSQIMDSALVEKSVSHTASCARCAARLADERALTAGLRRLSATETAKPPARIESALLAAFRQQHSTSPAPVRNRFTARRWLYVGAGAAAAAIIVTLLSLIASRTRDAQSPAVLETAAPTTATVQREPPPTSPSLSPGKTAINRPARSIRRTPAELKNASVANSRSNRVDEPSREVEIATDFIPLMNLDGMPQSDSGQVMRVELPRSALMSFGLPMNMERAGDRIKADVVVGNDGLARAIRFVR